MHAKCYINIHNCTEMYRTQLSSNRAKVVCAGWNDECERSDAWSPHTYECHATYVHTQPMRQARVDLADHLLIMQRYYGAIA